MQTDFDIRPVHPDRQRQSAPAAGRASADATGGFRIQYDEAGRPETEGLVADERSPETGSEGAQHTVPSERTDDKPGTPIQNGTAGAADGEGSEDVESGALTRVGPAPLGTDQAGDTGAGGRAGRRVFETPDVMARPDLPVSSMNLTAPMPKPGAQTQTDLIRREIRRPAEAEFPTMALAQAGARQGSLQRRSAGLPTPALPQIELPGSSSGGISDGPASPVAVKPDTAFVRDRPDDIARMNWSASPASGNMPVRQLNPAWQTEPGARAEMIESGAPERPVVPSGFDARHPAGTAESGTRDRGWIVRRLAEAPTQPSAMPGAAAAQPSSAVAEPPNPVESAGVSGIAEWAATAIRETATAPVRANPADTPAMIRQFVEITIRQPDRQVEIMLKPEQFGRVRLLLTTSEHGTTIAVATDRGETLDLIRRHAHDLIEEFRRQGFGAVDLDFGESSHRQTPDHASLRRSGSRASAEQNTGPAQTPAPESVHAVPRSLASTGLDLRM